jgi:SAM-dependent methyltransferase
MQGNLADVERRFAFGRNWADYSRLIGEQQIAEAIAGLRRLLGDFDLRGRRFLDIGSGSGLHAVAALRLGASEVVAIDLDQESVTTTKEVLTRFAQQGVFRVERRSVFDLGQPGLELGTFDVVYSWGVLHHTGDLVSAVRRATEAVAAGGLFVFALYRRTYLCRFWAWEKRWYSSASAPAQCIAREVFTLWSRAIFCAVGIRHALADPWRRRRYGVGGRSVSFKAYVANYASSRGMDFQHDVHDWLGGFPYQSILPAEVDRLMTDCGLTHQSSYFCAPKSRKTHGLLGSGCDEYVYSK